MWRVIDVQYSLKKVHFISFQGSLFQQTGDRGGNASLAWKRVKGCKTNGHSGVEQKTIILLSTGWYLPFLGRGGGGGCVKENRLSKTIQT